MKKTIYDACRPRRWKEDVSALYSKNKYDNTIDANHKETLYVLPDLSTQDESSEYENVM